jgi:hypothetical protein
MIIAVILTFDDWVYLTGLIFLFIILVSTPLLFPYIDSLINKKNKK